MISKHSRMDDDAFASRRRQARPQSSALWRVAKAMGVLTLIGLLITLLVFVILDYNKNPHHFKSDATIVGPLGDECSADTAVCTTFPSDQQPIDVNIVDAIDIAGPLGHCNADNALCMTVASGSDAFGVFVTNDTLAVTLVGTGGECTVGNASCFTFAQDQPPIPFIGALTGPYGPSTDPNDALSVTIVNPLPIPVEIVGSNFTLNVDVIVEPVVQANITSPLGHCNADNALCMTVASGSDAFGVFVTNDTLSVTLIGNGNECTVGNASCFAIATDQPPIPFLGTLTGPFGPYTDPLDALSVTLVGNNVDGKCFVNDSVCFSMATDQQPIIVDVPGSVDVTVIGPLGAYTVDGSIPVTMATDQPPINVNVVNAGINITANVTIIPIVHSNISAPLGRCNEDIAVCVTLSNQTEPVITTISNPSLAVTVTDTVDVNVLGPIGQCNASNGLCVTIGGQAAPLDVQVTFPTGTQLTNGSIPVTIASDQVSIPVLFDTNYTDVFGNLRVVNPNQLFNSKLLNAGADDLFFTHGQTSGSGTTYVYNINRASITMGVASLTAGHILRQSRRRMNYEPGAGQYIMMTVIPGLSGTGITKRWGYYGDNNGDFFELDGSNHLWAVIRTSVSGVPVDRRTDITANMPSYWSPANGQIYGIEFAWLGEGTTRFFIVNNTRKLVLHTDNGGTPFAISANPNSPVRYELINDGTGGANTLEMICVTVMSEGGSNAIGFPSSVDRGSSVITLSTDSAVHAVLAVRLDTATYLHASSVIASFNTACTSGSSTYRWELRYRPTVAGAALVWNAQPNSPLDYAIPVAANTITGGTLLGSGYTVGTSQTSGVVAMTAQAFYLGADYTNTADLLVLGIQRLTSTGATDDYLASMAFSSTF